MNKKGFTLIELVIAISIFSIFSLTLYKTYFDELKYNGYLTDTINAQNAAREAVEGIVSEIENNEENIDLANSSDNSIKKLIYSTKEAPYLVNFTGSSNGDIYLKSNTDFNGNVSYSLKHYDGTELCRNMDIPKLQLDKGSGIICISISVYISNKTNHMTMNNEVEKYTLKTSINIKK